MLVKFSTPNTLLALALIFGVGATPAIYAENSGQAGAPQQLAQAEETTPTMNPADVSEAHLEKFANISLKAHEIEAKYEDEMDRVKTMDDVEQIQQKMNGELIDAIQSEDMSVEEYELVGTAIQHDPELSKRVFAKMGEKTRQTHE